MIHQPIFRQHNSDTDFYRQWTCLWGLTLDFELDEAQYIKNPASKAALSNNVQRIFLLCIFFLSFFFRVNTCVQIFSIK